MTFHLMMTLGVGSSCWILLLALISICQVFGTPDTVPVESHCNDVIFFHQSKLVVLEHWANLSANGTNCTLGFLAFTPYHHNGNPSRIHVTVLHASLPGTSVPCHGDRLDIIDSDKVTVLSGKDGICGDFTGSFDSTHDTVYFRVTSSNVTLKGRARVLFSAFNSDTCDTEKEFCCDNGRCVDESMTCDGYDDCSDDSDEDDGCMFSTGVIAGIAVGSCVAMALMVVVVVLAWKRKWRTGWGAGPNPSLQPYSINEERQKLLS